MAEATLVPLQPADAERRREPHLRERLRGLCILVWRATDGREFSAATNHCGLDEVPIYAGFR